ncbi:hypothetical protein FB451DRAFT_1185884 [Mycena latifolia]|nr:hypothetical protein FB451DRAFT_1185884 [Mycena latifolia]
MSVEDLADAGQPLYKGFVRAAAPLDLPRLKSIQNLLEKKLRQRQYGPRTSALLKITLRLNIIIARVSQFTFEHAIVQKLERLTEWSVMQHARSPTGILVRGRTLRVLTVHPQWEEHPRDERKCKLHATRARKQKHATSYLLYTEIAVREQNAATSNLLWQSRSIGGIRVKRAIGEHRWKKQYPRVVWRNPRETARRDEVVQRCFHLPYRKLREARDTDEERQGRQSGMGKRRMVARDNGHFGSDPSNNACANIAGRINPMALLLSTTTGGDVLLFCLLPAREPEILRGAVISGLCSSVGWVGGFKSAVLFFWATATLIKTLDADQRCPRHDIDPRSFARSRVNRVPSGARHAVALINGCHPGYVISLVSIAPEYRHPNADATLPPRLTAPHTMGEARGTPGAM